MLSGRLAWRLGSSAEGCVGGDDGRRQQRGRPDESRTDAALRAGDRCLEVALGRFVVHPQQVAPEVAVEVAPDGVDVIAVALGCVELDQEQLALDPVVVPLAALERSGPAEPDRLDAALAYARHSRLRKAWLETRGVDLDQLP